MGVFLNPHFRQKAKEQNISLTNPVVCFFFYDSPLNSGQNTSGIKTSVLGVSVLNFHASGLKSFLAVPIGIKPPVSRPEYLNQSTVGILGHVALYSWLLSCAVRCSVEFLALICQMSLSVRTPHHLHICRNKMSPNIVKCPQARCNAVPIENHCSWLFI